MSLFGEGAARSKSRRAVCTIRMALLAATLPACGVDSVAPKPTTEPEGRQLKDGGVPKKSSFMRVYQAVDSGFIGECVEVGEERPAEPDEDGEYCVCSAWGDWACYGLVQGAEPTGGAMGSAPPVCITFHASVPAVDTLTCYVGWSNCDDAQDYAVSCIDGECWCLVNERPWKRLEPTRECPVSIAEINRECGWHLSSKYSTGNLGGK